ncbi:TonB-dependent receptor [Enterobacter hormaechei]|nr:TonB-dependent receptor [Enterobacter hormaechei]
MSAYAHAAETPKKEETITVTAAPAAQESAWGPAPTIAAKRTATATKTDTPIEKTPQSISVVTREEMDMKQPGTVKQALAYTPNVFATRGASTTYDVVSIRGFTTSSTVNTNQYLDGMKLQGDNYSEASMDPYFLERVELLRGPTSVLYGKSHPGGKPFDPARGKQYEAGVKYVPKDLPVVVTAAVYQLTKNNNLTADPANPTSGFSVQGGEIRSRGFELEAKAAVSANVNVTAAYSYTDAEYTHDTWYEGRRPAEVPRNMASLWADYTFHETALSGLTVGAGARYIGNTVTYYSSASPKAYESFNVAGYALADATVKYDLARFGLPGSSVGVNVNNIFDREYVSSCYSEYACYWGAGRQVVATATFRF